MTVALAFLSLAPSREKSARMCSSSTTSPPADCKKVSSWPCQPGSHRTFRTEASVVELLSAVVRVALTTRLRRRSPRESWDHVWLTVSSMLQRQSKMMWRASNVAPHAY